MVGEMLEKLESTAPQDAVGMLNEFREHQWKPLSSFVHGGLHAIHRHDTGYPVVLLLQVVKSSNGLLIMAAMMLVILHGGKDQRGKIPAIEKEFDDCLPPPEAIGGGVLPVDSRQTICQDALHGRLHRFHLPVVRLLHRALGRRKPLC